MNKLKVLFFTIVMLIVITGCSINEISFKLEDKSVTYDGNVHELIYEEELNDVEVIYENNKHTEVGIYEVKAIFNTNEKEYISYATLTIKPKKLTYNDFDFINSSIFDNEYKEITFTNELIEGLTYSYLLENKYKEVGIYNNVLIISSNNKNYESTEIEVSYTILEYNFDNFIFNSNSFLYDNTIKSLELNVPNGYEVEYINNDQIEIGSYEVIANIIKDNNIIHSLSAILEIYSNEEIDELFNSTFNNTYLEYNGTNQSIYLANEEELLKYGYEIEYIYNTEEQINSGVYLISAVITKDNLINTVSTTYEINKKELEVNFIGNTTYYENEEINLVIDLDLNVEYIYYDELFNIIDKPTSVGTYYIEAIFNEENYLINNLIKQFNIIVNDTLLLENSFIENKEVDFNYENHFIKVNNEIDLLNNNFNITYYYNNDTILPFDSGVYNVLVIITKDELYKELECLLIINKIEVEVSINQLWFKENTNLDFNLEINANVDIEYTYYDMFDNKIEEPTEVGLYQVKPIFNNNKNYIIEERKHHFVIILNKEDTNLINNTYLEDKEVTFDNNNHFIKLNNEIELLNSNFVIEYSLNEFINTGIYNIYVVVYKGAFVKEFNATLTINKLEVFPIFNEIEIKENNPYHITFNLEIESDYEYIYYLNDQEINKPSTYGNYLLKVIFNNYDKNYLINDAYYSFNIKLNDYHQSLIDNAYLEDIEVDYNSNYYISVSNSRDLLFERFNIIYTFNNEEILPTEIGTYEVVALIIKNSVVVKELNCTLTIK